MATPLQKTRHTVRVVSVGDGVFFDREVMVPAGQTVGWAVNASGIYALFPQVREAVVGVWGKKVAREALSQAGDRVEVYLPCNPEAVQRARGRGKTLPGEL